MSRPMSLAASIRSIPLGASSSRPSMVSLTVSIDWEVIGLFVGVFGRPLAALAPRACRIRGGGPPATPRAIGEAGARCLRANNPVGPLWGTRSASPWIEGAALVGDVALVFVAVLLDRCYDRTGGEVAQGAQDFA